MRLTTRLLLVAAVLMFLGLGFSAAQAADKGQAAGHDQWRYVLHNNEWWYWLPEGRWLYWRNNHWNAYDPDSFSACPVNSGSAARFAAGDGSQTGPQSNIRPFYGHSLSNFGAGYGNQAQSQSDIRPFYGHSFSDVDRRRPVETEEIGPFYGNALPSEILGR